MQDHFERHTFLGVANAQLMLSFAGTVMELFVDLMGPLAHITKCKFGTKTVLIVGTILETLGLMMAGFTNQIWHLYLTQGILFGTGASFMFMMAASVTTQWFNRRRGLALGMASSGSGIGGLVLPFIVTPLNNSLGIGWSYRVVGFICLGLGIIACILVKEKPTPKKTPRSTKLKDIVDLGIFRNKNYIMWVIGSLIGLMGYFVPFFLLPSYVTYLGMTPTDGSTFMAVLSAANFIGRITVGFLGDRIGRLNANIIFTYLTGLTSFLIWNFAYKYNTVMAFSVLFGFFSPSYFALMSPITATILGMDKFPTGLSMLVLSNVISVFGPTIASGIESSVSSEPYLTYKVFTGTVYVVAGIILSALKINMTKSLFRKI